MDEGITIQLIEPNTFRKRFAKDFAINLVISIAFSLVMINSGSITLGITIGLLIFLVQLIKSNNWNRTFIESIIIEREIVNIKYNVKGDRMVVSDTINNFAITTNHAFNRIPTEYLRIVHDGIEIRQYQYGGWDKTKFDEIVAEFRSRTRAL